MKYFHLLGCDDKNLGEICLGDMSKNVHFQFRGSQMHFSLI